MTSKQARWSAIAASLAAVAAGAADWPQFLGPNRDGTSPASDLAESWPKEGPPVVWQRKVGQGFSGPVVALGKVILFHRVDDKETVECLRETTGQPLWRFDYPTRYRDDFGFDEGPRATPAIADGRVYTYGAEGVLQCLDLATGTNIWTVDAKAQFHAAKGFFGIACSPLVEGKAVLLIVGGGDGAGIVAFDKTNGKVLWKATNDEASYSSPVAATIRGRRCGFFFTRSGLAAVDPTSGKILFQFPFRPPIRNSVSAATPLVVGDLVFLSASYDTGAVLLRVNEAGPEKIWAAAESLSSHYATGIHYNGFIYGIHGRADPGFEPPASLRCVELQTGKVRWQQDAFGAATMILAGDQLLILTDRGELIRAPASPEGYKPNARAQVLPNQVRAHPALANGLFYARSKDKLVCLDLRKGNR
jgi:outer membrane protein assembly factor BamB